MAIQVPSSSDMEWGASWSYDLKLTSPSMMVSSIIPTISHHISWWIEMDEEIKTQWSPNHTISYPHVNIDGLVMMFILDFATLVIWPDVRSINVNIWIRIHIDPHHGEVGESATHQLRKTVAFTWRRSWSNTFYEYQSVNVCKLKGLFGKLVYSSSGVKDIGVMLSTAPQPGFNYVTAKHGCALETWRQLAVLHLVWYVFSEKYRSSFRQAPWLGCGFCGMAGFGSHIWRFPWRVLCGSWLPCWICLQICRRQSA